MLTGDNITHYATGKGEMTCQHSNNKTCNCHISLLMTGLYFCLFRAPLTLKNPKEILKYIQELKADSTKFLSCKRMLPENLHKNRGDDSYKHHSCKQ